MGGHDALYLAQAESLGFAWLTADAKVLRRLRGDRRIRPLEE
jgi:predicted nucleic acid-binding protein